MPAAEPRSSARQPPSSLDKPPTVAATATATVIVRGTAQSDHGALLSPSVGSPTTRKIAKEIASMIASDHAERVMRIPENLAERGSANSNEVTISGCTTNTEPNDSATACM